MKKIALYIALAGMIGCDSANRIAELEGTISDLESRISKLESRALIKDAGKGKMTKDRDSVAAAIKIRRFLKEYLGAAFGDPIEKYPQVHEPEGGLGKVHACRIIPFKKRFGCFKMAYGGFADGKLEEIDLDVGFDEKCSQQDVDELYMRTKTMLEQECGIYLAPFSGRHRSLRRPWHDAGTHVESVEPYFILYTGCGKKFINFSISDMELHRKRDSRQKQNLNRNKNIGKDGETQNATKSSSNNNIVQATGDARTRNEALLMAFCSAIEQFLRMNKADKTIQMRRERMLANPTKVIESFRIVKEMENTTGWHVEVVAKILPALFYIDCSSSDFEGDDVQTATRYTEFFADIGLKTCKTPDDADYFIKVRGEYRQVEHPDDGTIGMKYSMSIDILSKSGERVFSIANDARKNCTFVGNIEQQRAICSEKAFRQMKRPVREKIAELLARNGKVNPW